MSNYCGLPSGVQAADLDRLWSADEVLPEWLRLPLPLSGFEAASGGGTGVPEAEAAAEAGR